MGKSKKNLAKQAAGIKEKIRKLEEKGKLDPLHRQPEIWDELEKLKKKLEEDD